MLRVRIATVNNALTVNGCKPSVKSTAAQMFPCVRVVQSSPCHSIVVANNGFWYSAPITYQPAYLY